MTFSTERQRTGWLLLALFVFQLTAGALHRLELHGGSHFGLISDEIFFQSISCRTGHDTTYPTHDPAHCSICQHLLNNPFTLLIVISSIARFEALIGILILISMVLTDLPAHRQRPRAPPTFSFSL